jgi:hypothetical protein
MKDTTSVSSHLFGLPDTIFPAILWIVFWAGILIVYNDVIRAALRSLLVRLRNGANIKFLGIELGALTVSTTQISHPKFTISNDSNGVREKERANRYTAQRGVMLVHQIFKSQQKGQLYDVLVYIIPHKTMLTGVDRVEYFFGKYWNNHIFSANDSSNGFAIVTCAYGPFLCSAKVYFNDGQDITIFRYIDFEMGNVAATAEI